MLGSCFPYCCETVLPETNSMISNSFSYCFDYATALRDISNIYTSLQSCHVSPEHCRSMAASCDGLTTFFRHQERMLSIASMQATAAKRHRRLINRKKSFKIFRQQGKRSAGRLEQTLSESGLGGRRQAHRGMLIIILLSLLRRTTGR